MFTKFLLVQKIESNPIVENHLIRSSDHLQWTFEIAKKESEFNQTIFPFSIRGTKFEMETNPPAPETSVYLEDNQIVFADDYCVPSGFTIGILFPEGFVPTIVKFKDKPVLPIGAQGQYVTVAQGQFQVLYNKPAQRCAIIFNIHHNICFGFKCKAIKVHNDDFPSSGNTYNDDFDIIIDSGILGIGAITTDDLKFINHALDQTHIDDIKDIINEVLNALKSKDKSTAKTKLENLKKYILDGTSFTGNITKIVDSYNEGGAPQKFITSLMEYVNL